MKKLVLLSLAFTLILSCKKDEIETISKNTIAQETSLSSKLQKARRDIKNNQNLLSFSETVFDESNRQLIFNAKSGNYTLTEEEGRILTQEEELFFENYFYDLYNSDLTKLEVTNYYINITTSLELEAESEVYCLETLSLLNILLEEIYNSPATPWDDRWDECMRLKAKAVFEDGNWIDKLEFLSNPGAAVLIWTASCAWEASNPSS